MSDVFVEFLKNCLTDVVGVIKVCKLLIWAEQEGFNNKYHKDVLWRLWKVETVQVTSIDLPDGIFSANYAVAHSGFG